MAEQPVATSPADRLAVAWARHSGAVLAYAARRTTSPEDAADVLAETFLIAWRRIEALPAEPDSRPWLFTVARNVLANQQRATRRRAAATEALVAEAARTVAAHHRAPDDEPGSAALGRALARLTAADREVLLLAGWEGLTPAEIAVVVACSPAAARVRLHRARRRLRVLLAIEDRAAGPHPSADPAPAPMSTTFLEVPR